MLFPIWHDLHLYQNGGWAIDDKAPKDYGAPIQSISIEEYHSVERYRLLLMYESTGNVDVVPINVKGLKGDEREKANDWLNQRGWSIGKQDTAWGNNPNVKMACAHKRDLLAVVYKANNETFVKTVPVEDFSLHGGFGQGNTIVPTKAKSQLEECYIYPIPQRYYELIYKLNKPIGGEGISIKLKKYQPIINILNDILSEEHNVRFM